jgi:hypothetical protein
MVGFSDIQAVLDKAIGGANVNIGAHHAFWRGITRDQFVAKTVFTIAVVAVGDASSSNIIKALRGQVPFGNDVGTVGANLPRMPYGMAAMPEADINLIEGWINNGCPA